VRKRLPLFLIAALTGCLLPATGGLAVAQASPGAATVVSLAGGGVDDGVAATSVPLGATWATMRSDGATLIADGRHDRIRSVEGDGLIRTIVGDGAMSDGHGAYGGDGGPATAASLDYPSQVLSSPSGDLIVLDRYNDRVRLVDHTTQTITTIAGNGQPGPGNSVASTATAQPMTPSAIAYDPTSGVTYVADWARHVIWAVAADGGLSIAAGGGNGSLTNGASATSVNLPAPDSLAVLPDGSLLIGSSQAGEVWSVTDGTTTLVAGSGVGIPVDGVAATASPLYVYSLVAAPDGTVWVGGSPQPVSFTIGGNVHVLAGAPCGMVTGLDLQDRPMLACDAVFDQAGDGSWTRVAGASGTDGTDTTVPDGVTADNAAMWISGMLQQGGATYLSVGTTVQRIGTDGVVHRFAGTDGTTASGGDEGPASSAAFTAARNLLPAPGGGMFVRDGNTIRLIDSSGTIHAWVGSSPSYFSTVPDGSPAASLGNIGALAVAADGTLYIGHNQSILAVNYPSDTVRTVVSDVQRLGGLYDSPSDEPSSLGVAPDGSLLIADTMTTGPSSQTQSATRIVRLEPSTGDYSVLAFTGPVTDMTVGTDGTIYLLTSSSTPHIDVLGADGSLTQIAGGGDEAGASQTGDALALSTGDRLAPAADGGLLIASFDSERLLELQPGFAVTPLAPVSGVHAAWSSGSQPTVTVSWTSPGGPPSGGSLLFALQTGPQPAPASSATGFDGFTLTQPLTSTSFALASGSTQAKPGTRDVISVYVSDAAGDLSAPATVITVAPGDTTPPSSPSLEEVWSTDGSATVDFVGTDDPDLAAVDLRVAAGDAAPDPSATPDAVDYPHRFGGDTDATVTGLTVGQEYSLTLTAIDFSGNTTVSGPYHFTAGSAPIPTWMRAPADGGYISASANFVVMSDLGAITCTLDGKPLRCGGWPITLPGPDGTVHTVTGQVYGPLGYGPVVSRTITVDAKAPAVTMTALPRVTFANKLAVTAAAHDSVSGVASTTVRYRTLTGGAVSKWTQIAAAGQPTSVAIPTGATVCAQASAIDNVGNASAWTPQTCATRPLDDRALTASKGWTSITGAAFSGHTATRTSKSGASLTLPNATSGGIVVVATRCPTCGSIRVVSGHTTLATINLHASKTQEKWTDLITFRQRASGRLRLVVSTSDRLVQVDAAGVVRTS
jgi:hypothetical protein